MKRKPIHVFLFFLWLLSACGPEPTPSPTAEATPSKTVAPTAADVNPYPLEPYPAVSTEGVPGNVQPSPYPAPQDTPAPPATEAPSGNVQETQYPPPGDFPTSPPSGGYPPPAGNQTPAPTVPSTAGTPQYPGPQETQPPAPTSGPARTPRFTPSSSETPGFEVTATPTISGTILATPTERPIWTAMPPPGSIDQTITIWHSWNSDEVQVLDFVLKTFQDFYPGIAFNLLYVPQEELLARYEMAAYRGEGPALLFGPAEWGAPLYEKRLVADLSEDADPRFLAEINAAALGCARYRNALTGLPYRIRSGILLYRNTTLLHEAPASYTELVSTARAATRGGRVGAYLERSFLYSAGHLDGLGGRLMDENGQPAFNTPQGVAWLELLSSFDQAGAVEFNGDRDLNLFKEGKVGWIIDGSWNMGSLAEAIGENNLAIDPWPSVKGGRLAGFVQADSVFLNARLTGDERYAALLYMGFMMAREVQTVLARAGHIPAVLDVEVNDPLIRQAARAFEGGAAYPSDPALAAYWDPLEAAMRSVFEQGADPKASLIAAEKVIIQKLQEK